MVIFKEIDKIIHKSAVSLMCDAHFNVHPFALHNLYNCTEPPWFWELPASPVNSLPVPST